MPTLYAVTIDNEEQWDWDAGWPVQSHSLENTAVLPRFEEHCAKHGARTTWLTNWSVMNHGPSREIMLGIAARPGVEIGMHIHPWLTPPVDEKSEITARASFLHTHPADQIRAKLSSVYELFERDGINPVSFRGGRYSSGGVIHEFLMSKGFVTDSSVVPFTTWPDEGAPDYRDRDLTPRRIANGGQPGLWEIPLSLGFTRAGFRRWARWFEAIEHSPLRHLRLIGVLGALGGPRRVWLNFEDTPPEDMFGLLRVLRAMQVPFVIFTVHSSSLVAGGNPYSRTPEHVARIWATVDHVLGTVEGWSDFRPATLAEIAGALEADHSLAKNSGAKHKN